MQIIASILMMGSASGHQQTGARQRQTAAIGAQQTDQALAEIDRFRRHSGHWNSVAARLILPQFSHRTRQPKRGRPAGAIVAARAGAAAYRSATLVKEPELAVSVIALLP